MKKLFLIAIFISSMAFAQDKGTKVSAPLQTEIDSILLLATNQRVRHVPYTNLRTKLEAYFDTQYAPVGATGNYTAGDGLTLTGTEFKLGGTYGSNVQLFGDDYFAIYSHTTNQGGSSIYLDENRADIRANLLTGLIFTDTAFELRIKNKTPVVGQSLVVESVSGDRAFIDFADVTGSSLPGVSASGTPGSGNYVFEAGDNTNDLGIKLDENAGYIYLGTSANPFRIDGAGDAYMVGQFNLTGGLDATGNVSGADATQPSHFITKQQFDANSGGATSLNGLTDVDLSTPPALGQYLQYNGVVWLASNLPIIDDDTFATATPNTVPSSESVAAYVQSQLPITTIIDTVLTTNYTLKSTDLLSTGKILYVDKINDSLEITVPDLSLGVNDREQFQIHRDGSSKAIIKYTDGITGEYVKHVADSTRKVITGFWRGDRWTFTGAIEYYVNEAYGPELLDTSLMSIDGTGVTHSAGTFTYNNASNFGNIRLNDFLTIGETYKVEFEVTNYSSGTIRVGKPDVMANVTANGTYSYEIVATNDDFQIDVRSAGTTLDLSNISVKLKL